MSGPYNQLVVKVGTSILTDSNGRVDKDYIEDLVGQLGLLRKQGRNVVLVTSGAIRCGRERLASIEDLRSCTLPYKQAAAAIGQGLLMRAYTDALERRGIPAAQLLLTRDDLADRHRFLNARNTLTALLSIGALPIVNENDTVAVDEIRFGDNDTLAARVAVLVEADLLVILSDVHGLYRTDPTRGEAKMTDIVKVVERITPEIKALAGGKGSEAGTGGMRTKVEAALIACSSGIRTVIAHGRCASIVTDVANGMETGTHFLPTANRLRGRKRWIAAGSRVRGSIVVNDGALRSLQERSSSLLPVGIVEVVGDFVYGDLVEIRDRNNTRHGRGITNYRADDLRRIAGLHTDMIEAVLGGKPYDEVVHRDNIVLD